MHRFLTPIERLCFDNLSVQPMTESQIAIRTHVDMRVIRTAMQNLHTWGLTVKMSRPPKYDSITGMAWKLVDAPQDVVRLRLENILKGLSANSSEEGFKCPSCDESFTTIDLVDALMDFTGDAKCPTCDSVLEESSSNNNRLLVSEIETILKKM